VDGVVEGKNLIQVDVIAYDLQSSFHVYSAMAWVLKNGAIVKSATFFVCAEKVEAGDLEIGSLEVDGVAFRFVKQEKTHAGLPGFFSLVASTLAFFSGLFLNKKRLVFLHHSYAKLTAFHFCKLYDAPFAKFVSFEEGTGSYSDLKSWVKSSKIEGKLFPRISYYIKKCLGKICVENFRVLDGFDSENSSSFRIAVDAFEAFNSPTIFACYDSLQASQNKQTTCLFFTSPLVDYWGMSEKDYAFFVEAVIGRFSDMEIWIKPHPLEKHSLSIYRSLGVRVLDGNIGGEFSLSRLKPNTVLGLMSGVMLVAKNIYGVNVFRVERYLPPRFRHLTYVSKAQTHLFKAIPYAI
jgi:Alpha-2,8-polysialyltransferase (POLYST)